MAATNCDQVKFIRARDLLLQAAMRRISNRMQSAVVIGGAPKNAPDPILKQRHQLACCFLLTMRGSGTV